MAIGAYSAVMVAKFLGVPTSVSFLIGGLVPAVVSLVIGRIVLRLQGVYFALTTIALVEVIRIAYSRGGNLTGGLAGMSGIPPLSIFGKSITSNEEFYVFGFILVLIVIFILHRIEVSRVGYTWKALSQSDNLASASGISTMGYKTAAFAVGCFFAGVAGAFMAYFSRYLVPTMFDFNMAVHILIYNYVGGLTTIAGPILGAGFFTFLSEPFKGFAQYETLFFGSALIIVIVLLPGGIITLPERIKTVITSHRFSRNSGVATER
jgi:branched-chain amino acid transport system permease protein